MLQPPPPPSITPRQMNLLRVVASMAWSDGELATEEVNLMLDRFCRLFARGCCQAYWSSSIHRTYFGGNCREDGSQIRTVHQRL